VGAVASATLEAAVETAGVEAADSVGAALWAVFSAWAGAIMAIAPNMDDRNAKPVVEQIRMIIAALL
jgi:hypothetical protein